MHAKYHAHILVVSSHSLSLSRSSLHLSSSLVHLSSINPLQGSVPCTFPRTTQAIDSTIHASRRTPVTRRAAERTPEDAVPGAVTCARRGAHGLASALSAACAAFGRTDRSTSADRHTHGTASWRQLAWQSRSWTQVELATRRLKIAADGRGGFGCIRVQPCVF